MESQRRFGIRYFEDFNTKSNVIRPLDNEKELVKVCCEKTHLHRENIYSVRAIYIRKVIFRRSDGIFNVSV